MKTMKSISILLCLVYITAFHEPTSAQYHIPQSVFGNGGAPINNGSYRISGTMGQPAIGVISSAAYINDVGFWYQSIEIITGVDPMPNSLPMMYRLEQNYPNPFNPTTIICYSLPELCEVTLQVFTLLGQPMKELVRTRQSSGLYSVSLDASDLASGVYFYHLEAYGKINWSQTRKFIFIK